MSSNEQNQTNISLKKNQTEIVTKLTKLKHFNWDKTEPLKLTQLKNSNCNNTNLNSKFFNSKKLKKLNGGKSQKLKL